MNILLQYHGYITALLIVALIFGLVFESRYARRWRRHRAEQLAQYRDYLKSEALSRLVRDMRDVSYRAHRPPPGD